MAKVCLGNVALDGRGIFLKYISYKQTRASQVCVRQESNYRREQWQCHNCMLKFSQSYWDLRYQRSFSQNQISLCQLMSSPLHSH
jgi:hypothetical protein